MREDLRSMTQHHWLPSPAFACHVTTLAIALVAPIAAQTFGPPIQTATPFYQMRGTCLVDLDRDGNPDIATVDYSFPSGRMTYRYGLGDGTFGPASTVVTGPAATTVVGGDFNGDGRPDLVVATSSASYLHLTTSSGEPGPALSMPSLQTPVVVDLDGDGALDLCGFRSGIAGCRVLFGNGSGGFPRQADLIPDGSANQRLVADLDGDGDDEVVHIYSSSTRGTEVQVLTYEGNGQIAFLAVQTLASDQPARVALADWDGDGLPDLVMSFGTTSGPGEVRCYRGLGTMFDSGQVLATGTGFVRQVIVTDLDADGRPDLLCCRGGNDLLTALRRPDGSLAPWMVQPGSTPLFPEVADVTRDGAPDLIEVKSNSIDVYHQVGMTHAGATSFGSGTPPCIGGITIAVDSLPAVGNTAMRVRFANAPASSLGLVFGGGPPNQPGYSHVLGMLLHTGQILSITLGTTQVDATGVLSMPMPIPNSPGLQGVSVYLQGVFLAETGLAQLCESAPNGLVSSLGLAVTVQ
jgi:hypothetical protein